MPHLARLLATTAFCGLSAQSGVLFAQQAPASTQFELTAFAGYQSSLDFSDQTSGGEIELKSANNAGIIIDVNLAPDLQLEFLYSQSRSGLDDAAGVRLADVKIEYLHAGAAYVYNAGRVRPFFVMTGGATRLNPSVGDGDTRFSLGLGGGVKFFLTDNIGLRIEARAYATQVDSDSATFCRNGTCRVYYDGDFLMQYVGQAGITIAF